MAAFSNIHFFESRAPCLRAPQVSSACAPRRRAADFKEIVSRVLAAVGETLLIVWMVLALAFWLLMLAGFLM